MYIVVLLKKNTKQAVKRLVEHNGIRTLTLILWKILGHSFCTDD